MISSSEVTLWRRFVTPCNECGALISVLVFAALAVKGDLGGKALKLYDTAMLMLDTIGLGIFTVTGITAAMRSGVSDNTFLLVFSGSYNRRWGRSSQGYFREQEA